VGCIGRACCAGRADSSRSGWRNHVAVSIACYAVACSVWVRVCMARQVPGHNATRMQGAQKSALWWHSASNACTAEVHVTTSMHSRQLKRWRDGETGQPPGARRVQMWQCHCHLAQCG
jgi:hypothetical protein